MIRMSTLNLIFLFASFVPCLRPGTSHVTSVAHEHNYKELYPEQWSHGYCYRDCLYDINTFCSREDNYCISCLIYCEEGQTYASNANCKQYCPGLFAYLHQSSTTTDLPTDTPSALIQVTTQHSKEDSNGIITNQSSTSTKATQVKEDITKSRLESEEPFNFHWLWLLLVPVTLIMVIAWCFRDYLNGCIIRWSDKLRNITIPYQVSDRETNRWKMTYFALPPSPLPETGEQNCAPFDLQTPQEQEEVNLLFDRSWPYPYHASTV